MAEENIQDLKDDVQDDKEGAEEEKKSFSLSGSKIVKILIYVAASILALFLMIGISYLVSKYMMEATYEKEQQILTAPPPIPLGHFDLEEFAVSTRDPEAHFIKLKLSLGYNKEDLKLQTELIERTVQLRHIINILLSGKRYEDLDSVEEKIDLAEEIKASINIVLRNGQIKEVYYREFVLS
jgi:flagellar FliL protein